MDAAAGGAFLSLKVTDATALVEKMASNQSWNEECVQPRKRGGGMHHIKEIAMVTAKLDLIMKKLDSKSNENREVMHIDDSYMTFEECGDTGNSGNNCPTLQEDVNFINNNTNYRPQQNQVWNQSNQRWNQPNQGWNQQRPNYQGNNQGNNNFNSNFNQPPLREVISN